MAVRFQCKCGKKFKTTDDKIGKKILCTACGAAITVPEADTVEVEDVAATASASSLASDLLRSAGTSSRKKSGEELPEEREPTIADEWAETGKEVAKTAIPILAGAGLVCLVVYYLSSSVMSSGPKHPPLGDVSGVVTLDGSPLPNAEVTFRPLTGDEEGNQAASIALTDEQGKYTLNYVANVPGAAVGLHRVEILARDEYGIDVVPAKFNSQTTLKFEVQEGSNEANFELTRE